MHRIDWVEGDESGTEFNLPISEWMRLFDETGFDLLSFHEIRSPSSQSAKRFAVSPEWAHDYPSEQVWKLRKR